MKHEYQKLIDALDKTLSILRRQLLNAKLKDKHEWERQIEDTLDIRLELMKQRDANADVAPPHERKDHE